jgi:hypothetical protein
VKLNSVFQFDKTRRLDFAYVSAQIMSFRGALSSVLLALALLAPCVSAMAQDAMPSASVPLAGVDAGVHAGVSSPTDESQTTRQNSTAHAPVPASTWGPARATPATGNRSLGGTAASRSGPETAGHHDAARMPSTPASSATSSTTSAESKRSHLAPGVDIESVRKSQKELGSDQTSSGSQLKSSQPSERKPALRSGLGEGLSASYSATRSHFAHERSIKKEHVRKRTASTSHAGKQLQGSLGRRPSGLAHSRQSGHARSQTRREQAR